MALVKFRIRRDTSVNWTSINPTLGLGEPALETDTLKVKYGDGVTAWTDLPYAGFTLDDVLAAYASGSMPSAFTLSIVDASDQWGWRVAIDAQQSSSRLTAVAGVTPIANGTHTVAGINITTNAGLITAIAAA
ncbi:PE-PGRS family protein [Sphingomonas sp. HH69]